MRKVRWKAAVALVLLTAPVLVASASAASPNVAAMNLQPADVVGAKLTTQRAVKEKGYIASYYRVYRFAAPAGSAKLVELESETSLAADVATATADIATAERGFTSTAGRKAFVSTVAKGLKVKPTAVAVGKIRRVVGYDQGFELPVSIKVKTLRIYENLIFLRLDRVAVFLVEIGLRQISNSVTSSYATTIASHIATELTPIAVSPPTITGTPQQGQTLTGTPGTWTAPDAVFTYQWQHCDAAGATCVDVAGATASTYAVTTADVGATLRVVVKAQNRFGEPTGTSAQTAVVI